MLQFIERGEVTVEGGGNHHNDGMSYANWLCNIIFYDDQHHHHHHFLHIDACVLCVCVGR